MTTTIENIGKKIRDLRTQSDLSLEQLATKAGISKAYVSQLENGGSTKPSAEVLYNIAIALNTNIAHLLGKTISENKNGALEIPANLQKVAQAHTIPSDIVNRMAMTHRREGLENKDYTEDQWLQYWLMIKSFDEKK